MQLFVCHGTSNCVFSYCLHSMATCILLNSILNTYYFARMRAVAKYCDEYICLFGCVSVCPRGYLRNHTCAIYRIFLCMLPTSVARYSSGTLMIGRITYRWKGCDGSAQRGRSVIYHCLVLCCKRLITGSIARSANLPVFSLLRGQF